MYEFSYDVLLKNVYIVQRKRREMKEQRRNEHKARRFISSQ